MIVLSKEENDKLAAMETITVKDIQVLFQNNSSGKIKKPKIGKLSIVNVFIPDFRGSEILKVEGSYVFYAIEKLSFGLFSKSSYRMLIWQPVSKHIFAVPVESVRFEKPLKDEEDCYPVESCLILRREENKVIAKGNYEKKEHQLSVKRLEFSRDFEFTPNKISALEDTLKYCLEWSDPDWWVEQASEKVFHRAPMYYLRNEFDKIPSRSIAYPQKPRIHGGVIDE